MENANKSGEMPLAVEKSLVEIRKTVLEINKSIQKAETDRQQNIKLIHILRQELINVRKIVKKIVTTMKENKESSEAADRLLREKLARISQRSEKVHTRIVTQITQLEKDMIKVQDRLVVSETKIREVSREVQSMKVEMQKMQEILLRVKEQQSESVTNTRIEVTKTVETRIVEMTQKWIEKHIE